MENTHIKIPKLMQPTERFTLQFNTQTREYDLIPESGMDQHKIRRKP